MNCLDMYISRRINYKLADHLANVVRDAQVRAVSIPHLDSINYGSLVLEKHGHIIIYFRLISNAIWISISNSEFHFQAIYLFISDGFL